MKRTQYLVFALTAGWLGASACASAGGPSAPTPPTSRRAVALAPSPDPRIGLKAGLFDAEQTTWNLNVVSETPPAKDFIGKTNSDLAFTGHYVLQGNYNGIQVWDISNPSQPSLVTGYVCPASQSDVSVYKNLMFVSGEGLGGRLDCGTQGVSEAVSHERLRGIRIFDISDVKNPKHLTNVQTCRGSHTHTVLVDPNDKENIYVYVSGSAPPRPAEELAGCSSAPPSEDPNSSLFRIEVIRVPLAHPEDAAIVSSPRIFNDLVAPPQHGQAPEDMAALDAAKARGAFVVEVQGRTFILPDRFAAAMLDSIVNARGGSGPTAPDSAALRAYIPKRFARPAPRGDGPPPGPTQCHDITVYPGIGLAGGACGGYGLLLDISNPVDPKRIGAVSDSNFSYWHSATFNNDGTKVLFTDEWGGGGAPKCRETDPKEWGGDAIFTLEDGKMHFHSYYKLPVAQTSLENCVAHNGSLIPIPGRDVMVQSWYQGGVSVFDWTDPDHIVEIAFQDRGPVDPDRMGSAGTWSAYWYNGVIVSSEIARGLDIFELTPSDYISQNEIDAAKSIKLDYFNSQDQPKIVWPATFALAGAYVDQLERLGGLSADRISSVRQALSSAEGASVGARRNALSKLASDLGKEAGRSSDAAKVRTLASAVSALSKTN